MASSQKSSKQQLSSYKYNRVSATEVKEKKVWATLKLLHLFLLHHTGCRTRGEIKIKILTYKQKRKPWLCNKHNQHGMLNYQSWYLNWSTTKQIYPSFDSVLLRLHQSIYWTTKGFEISCPEKWIHGHIPSRTGTSKQSSLWRYPVVVPTCQDKRETALPTTNKRWSVQ